MVPSVRSLGINHTSPATAVSSFLTATTLCLCICPFLSSHASARQAHTSADHAGPGAPIPRGLRLAKPQLISLTTLAIIFTVIINHPSPLLSCPLLSSSPRSLYPPRPPHLLSAPAPALFSLLHSTAPALLCCCLVPRRLGCSGEITLTGANGWDAVKVVRERCACKLHS